MPKRGTLVILFGAIPATGWSIYLVQAGALWSLPWICVCWISAVALWLAGLAPNWTKARAVYRRTLALGLSLGICLAVIPAGLNAYMWLMNFGVLSPSEHLVILSVFGSLMAPIIVAAYSLCTMLATGKQRSRM